MFRTAKPQNSTTTTQCPQSIPTQTKEQTTWENKRTNPSFSVTRKPRGYQHISFSTWCSCFCEWTIQSSRQERLNRNVFLWFCLSCFTDTSVLRKQSSFSTHALYTHHPTSAPSNTGKFVNESKHRQQLNFQHRSLLSSRATYLLACSALAFPERVDWSWRWFGDDQVSFQQISSPPSFFAALTSYGYDPFLFLSVCRR